MQLYTVYFIWKLFYMFRVVPSPFTRSANNCIYSIWYLSHRYCYLPLSWKSWNRFECAVGGVRLAYASRPLQEERMHLRLPWHTKLQKLCAEFVEYCPKLQQRIGFPQGQFLLE